MKEVSKDNLWKVQRPHALVALWHKCASALIFDWFGQTPDEVSLSSFQHFVAPCFISQQFDCPKLFLGQGSKAPFFFCSVVFQLTLESFVCTHSKAFRAMQLATKQDKWCTNCDCFSIARLFCISPHFPLSCAGMFDVSSSCFVFLIVTLPIEFVVFALNVEFDHVVLLL